MSSASASIVTIPNKPKLFIDTSIARQTAPIVQVPLPPSIAGSQPLQRQVERLSIAGTERKSDEEDAASASSSDEENQTQSSFDLFDVKRLERGINQAVKSRFSAQSDQEIFDLIGSSKTLLKTAIKLAAKSSESLPLLRTLLLSTDPNDRRFDKYRWIVATTFDDSELLTHLLSRNHEILFLKSIFHSCVEMDYLVCSQKILDAMGDRGPGILLEELENGCKEFNSFRLGHLLDLIDPNDNSFDSYRLFHSALVGDAQNTLAIVRKNNFPKRILKNALQASVWADFPDCSLAILSRMSTEDRRSILKKNLQWAEETDSLAKMNHLLDFTDPNDPAFFRFRLLAAAGNGDLEKLSLLFDDASQFDLEDLELALLSSIDNGKEECSKFLVGMLTAATGSAEFLMELIKESAHSSETDLRLSRLLSFTDAKDQKTQVYRLLAAAETLDLEQLESLLSSKENFPQKDLQTAFLKAVGKDFSAGAFLLASREELDKPFLEKGIKLAAKLGSRETLDRLKTHPKLAIPLDKVQTSASRSIPNLT